MSRTTVIRTINAPKNKVFKTVADIQQFSKALPHIVKVEFLTDLQYGLDACFRETRLMNGKESVTELTVTEFEENERIRLVADSHGTTWDTTFTVAAKGHHTILTMTMDATAHNFLAGIMNRLIGGMVRKAIEHDMDCVKTFCENENR